MSRRPRHGVRGLRRAGRACLPPGRGPLQGLGLLLDRLRPRPRRGRWRTIRLQGGVQGRVEGDRDLEVGQLLRARARPSSDSGSSGSSSDSGSSSEVRLNRGPVRAGRGARPRRRRSPRQSESAIRCRAGRSRCASPGAAKAALRVLVVGSIHGNETAGPRGDQAAARARARRAACGSGRSARVNPDGVAAGDARERTRSGPEPQLPPPLAAHRSTRARGRCPSRSRGRCAGSCAACART